ncbi:MAG: SDR family NAD(P)-dependent oxidoreductase [Bacteroidetes bacterium]|nr:SDR family NAD(P)-dependent oxidoreductase [Bacteroidota bacterium]
MTSKMLLKKTAIITGSSGEIGRGIALQMAREGAEVVITFHTRKEKGEALQQEILSMGASCLLVKVDLSEPAEVELLVNQAISYFGKIDILVNNAGTSGFIGPVIRTPVEEWNQLLRTNLSSAFYICRLVVPFMIAREYGRIINISSIGYRRILPDMAAYLVSKAGLNTFTQALSMEVGRLGITVNAIAPGQVSTERVMKVRLPGLSKQTGLTIEEIQAGMLKESHTGRFTTVEDVAELAIFLASEKAGNLTGEIIDLAGGF